MGWGEAARLCQILRGDPSSMLTAACEGWDYPMTREDATLRDLFDLQYAKTGAKNRKPYQRPFKTGEDRDRSRKGDTKGRTQAEVISILRAHRGGTA